jgi:uncharacterized protein (DUF1015 family)
LSLIRPFTALRPAPGRAAEVIAPPYDVLSSTEARERVVGRPWSFLHISKPEIDLAADIDVHAAEVYEKGAANLGRMLDAGVLVRDAVPGYYVYRITMGAHVQTGIVAAASVADYDTNRIRKHEFTRPDKEDDRVRQIEAVGGHTGPVLLAYPAAPEVDALLAQAAAATPDADAVADDGIRHTLWVVRDTAVQARIGSAFDAMPALYIADGHHRSAAASRVAAARRSAGDGPDAQSQRFLAVAFPHHEMRILPYNRVVRDLGKFTATDFLAALGHDFEVLPAAAPVAPAHPGEFGLHLAGGRWFTLRLRTGRIPADDPVARLDVSLLATHALEPLLGITDPRRDPRIDFVGGIRGLPELEKRVASGEMAAAFSMHPTQLADLMAVADAGQVMPPKSTWFEPKLADGMASLMLD